MQCPSIIFVIIFKLQNPNIIKLLHYTFKNIILKLDKYYI